MKEKREREIEVKEMEKERKKVNDLFDTLELGIFIRCLNLFHVYDFCFNLRLIMTLKTTVRNAEVHLSPEEGKHSLFVETYCFVILLQIYALT